MTQHAILRDANGFSRASDRPLAGILLMALGVSILPLMDGIAKFLSADYPIMQIVWGRFFFHSLWLVPILLLHARPRDLIPRHPGVQILRGGFLLGATVCFFMAIRFMPLADALAILFISPMVCTILSPLVLKETVGGWRWAAVITGFIGALIVVRPGFGVFQWESLLAFAAGAFHGCYLVSTRTLSGSTNPVITLAYTAIVGTIAMSLIVPLVWIPPAPAAWGLMVAMGLLAAVGHFLIIKSFERAPAAVVAPVGYAEIIVASMVGYLFFSDFPDRWTWVGIAVIVSSGIVISVREGRNPAAKPETSAGGAIH